MNTKDFDYELPEELIAQTPLAERASSRLLVLDKTTGEVRHSAFYRIGEYLQPGDCLILNDTKVMPARLHGERADTGTPVEVLLLKRCSEGEYGEGMFWEALVRPGRRVRPGHRLTFGGGLLQAEVMDIVEGGNRIVRFDFEGIFEEILDKLGEMPLPPYIHEKLEDPDRYQTVYARETGSAAAPTAGLHFTNELLDELRHKGIRTGFVTLHVGLGTFRPVKEERIEDHEMHSEYCILTEETAELIRRCKAEGHRVIAVGTTSCRTLESMADPDTIVRAGGRWTDIFIYPGYEFKVIDGLITNFHLPESTLIMLVSALAGREHVLAAYREAVRERYRFFSFGDAMLILDNEGDEIDG
ncbi:MAG: tRNA preQ1(34) S-adenosylmethionine ribosyltransferase-isomerase QueA [Firmicutes bacterium]|nr:tRNA preQ1(34) S-adenosylmethionine ribosyltransferase-isomerase QueA [Bacillota bacterium]